MMQWLRQLDDSTGLWFKAFRENHSRWTGEVLDLSAMGSRTVLTVVVLFAVGLLISLRRHRTAGFVLAAALGGVLITDLAKNAIGRERPPYQDPLVHASGPAFPSGHSMLSATIYLTLALIVTAVVHHRRVRVYIIAASLAVVALVGLSRIYLGAHYLTDVVGGWLAGLVWALLCRRVEFRWVLRLERREQALRNRLVVASKQSGVGSAG
jgi:undecaprenyl-diphosphatase